MAIAAEDFIEPRGNITSEMFPDEDLEDRAQVYLDAVTSELTGVAPALNLEESIYHGVYVRFYEAAAAKATAEPIAGQLVDQGSIQYAQNRADQFLKLAAMHQAKLDALLVPATTVALPRYPFGAVPTQINP